MFNYFNFMKKLYPFFLVQLLFITCIPGAAFAEGTFSNEVNTIFMRYSASEFPADTGILQTKIAPGATLVLIADNFSFTEGPASDKNGNVFFTDQPNNRIWKYDIEGKLSIFMEDAGRSNGLYFDSKGNLISCADEHNQLWKISPGKDVTILLKEFKGQRFNGPNDVWENPVTGRLYFTDPYYKRNYWTGDHPHIKEERVYCLSKSKKKVDWVEEGLVRPNGIVGTPDGKFLFVADIGAGKTYKYKMEKSGKLSDRQLFVNQGSDGMTIDNEGNIYLTGDGVTVYNPQGQKIGHIPIPEKWTANVCFGGKKNNMLFITASKSVYTLQMKVHGVQ